MSRAEARVGYARPRVGEARRTKQPLAHYQECPALSDQVERVRHAYAGAATGTTFALTKNRLTPSFDTAEQVAGIFTKAVADR